MLRRIAFILFIIGLVCLGLRLSLSAQKSPREEIALYDYSADFERIEAKTDKLSADVDRLSITLDNTNKGILKKLDQVLSNQEKIINELEIVKVRASRR